MGNIIADPPRTMRSCIVGLALLCGMTCPAQDPPTGGDGTQAAVDSAAMEINDDTSFEEVKDEAFAVLDTMLPPQDARAFDESALEALRNNPKYQYEREVSEAPSAWDRFWKMVGNWIRDLLEGLENVTGLKFMSWFWDYIWFAVFAITLVILLVVLRRRMFSKVFARSVANAGSVRTLEEDITADDLPEQLADAELKSEWRRALRLQYLLVLRQLVDEERISWKPQHTDRDYQAQLNDENERVRFGRLSFIFKWVWYGEADLDRSQYESLSAGFVDFRSKQAA